MTSVQPISQGYQYYPEIKDIKEFPNHYEYTFKDEASSGKKWGVGIASALIPGLGQGINGEWGKAAAFFGGLIAASVVPSIVLAAKAVGGNFEKAFASAPALVVCSFLAQMGIRIWSSVHAVKNAGGEFKQIVPKEPSVNIQA